MGVAFTVIELPQHGELLVAPGTSYSDLSPATPGVAYAAGQVGLYYRAGVGYAGADRVRLVIHDAPFADRPVELAYFTTGDTGAAGGNPYAPTWSQASYLWGVYERPFMPADAEGAGDLNLSYSPPGTTTNGPTPGGAPLHGDVTVRADGTFTYRPHWLDGPDADADGRPDGEPYRGWDRFEVAVTPPHAPEAAGPQRQRAGGAKSAVDVDPAVGFGMHPQVGVPTEAAPAHPAAEPDADRRPLRAPADVAEAEGDVERHVRPLVHRAPEPRQLVPHPVTRLVEHLPRRRVRVPTQRVVGELAQLARPRRVREVRRVVSHVTVEVPVPAAKAQKASS